jgi:hypothetical protein
MEPQQRPQESLRGDSGLQGNHRYTVSQHQLGQQQLHWHSIGLMVNRGGHRSSESVARYTRLGIMAAVGGNGQECHESMVPDSGV